MNLLYSVSYDAHQLDFSQYWKDYDSRSDTCDRPGVWWFAVIQCGQLFAQPRPLNADIYNPKSALKSQGIHPVAGRRLTADQRVILSLTVTIW
jgi:hypothetical protein